MTDAPKDQDGLPRDLRFLKTLVTVLTVVMIAGVITITALLVIRLNETDRPQVMMVDPAMFPLPQGVTMTGVQIFEDLVLVTGDDGMLRVYDAETQDVLREIDLTRRD